MKNLGIDQTTAWLFSFFLTCMVFSGLYMLGKTIAKDPKAMKFEQLSEQGLSSSSQEEQAPEEVSPSSKPEQKKQAAQEGTAAPLNQEPAKEGPMLGQLAPWSYRGRTGPDHWGRLADAYLDCQLGREQSPIDLNSPIRSRELRPIKHAYRKSHIRLFNDGNTIRAEYEQGSRLFFKELEYKLTQLVFHIPSEHTLDGIPFDMELHLMHRNSKGENLILAIFIEEGNKSQAEFKKFWHTLPRKKSSYGAQVVVNAANFFPRDRIYFSYMGSLSSPPCSENVQWVLFRQSIKVSGKHIDEFISIFRNNARPIQGINKRSIYVSTNR